MREGTSQARILVVDDEEPNVRLLEGLLGKAGYTNVRATTDPRQVLRLYGEWRPDLILLDLRMPHLDGLRILELLHPRIPPDAYMPVLVLTADITSEAKERALSSGAKDFLTKPFDATEVLLRIRNLLEARFLHVELQKQNEILDERVRERTAHLWEAVQRLTESERATREATEETVRRLAAAAELRDPETGGHIERMSRYAALLAARLGLEPDRCELVRLASSMHDVGKIGVPDRILRKRGKLRPEEFEVMKQHPEVGHRVLAGSKAELLDLAATIALTHHERWDGSGYPRGLEREDIPLEGRVAAVADVFDALTTHRPYRRAFPVPEAVGIMQAGRASHFDPELLDTFLASLDDALGIFLSYSEEQAGRQRRDRRAR